MNSKTIQKMIGTSRTKKLHALKDSDGDKVINMLDCKPYNKKEQGLRHIAGAWVARKLGSERAAEYMEREGRREEEIRFIRAKEREKTRAERRRRAIRTAPTFGEYMRPAFAGPSPTPVVRKRVKKKKLKIGKCKCRKVKTKKSKIKTGLYGVPLISNLKVMR